MANTKIWLISDTHFNHKNIITYENRPFSSISDMNNELIKRWNATVAPDDLIIHLGDFALGSATDLDWLVSSLNGHKILILGNHDHASQHRFLRAGFEEVHPSLALTQYYPTGIKFNILFTHRPTDGGTIPHDLHIYGHVHGKGIHGDYPTIARNGACVCVERWNYTPVSLDRIIGLCLESGITALNVA